MALGSQVETDAENGINGSSRHNTHSDKDECESGSSVSRKG